MHPEAWEMPLKEIRMLFGKGRGLFVLFLFYFLSDINAAAYPWVSRDKLFALNYSQFFRDRGVSYSSHTGMAHLGQVSLKPHLFTFHNSVMTSCWFCIQFT